MATARLTRLHAFWRAGSPSDWTCARTTRGRPAPRGFTRTGMTYEAVSQSEHLNAHASMICQPRSRGARPGDRGRIGPVHRSGADRFTRRGRTMSDTDVARDPFPGSRSMGGAEGTRTPDPHTARVLKVEFCVRRSASLH